MSDKKQHIDELFRRGLSEHRSVPPPEVWGGISSHLSGKRRRRLLLYVARIAAGGLLLLGSGGIMYYFMQGNRGDNYLSPGSIATHSAEQEVPELRRAPLSVDKEENKIILPVAETATWPEESNVMAGNNSGSRKQKATEDILINAEHGISKTGVQIKDGTIQPEYPELVLQETLTAVLSVNINPGLAYKPAKPIITEHGLLTADAGTDMDDRRNRWSAAVMIAPNYSYRTLSSINSGSFTKEHYNSFESGLMSVSGSINLNYMISDRFSVQSGVDLLRMGQTIHRMKIFSDLLYKDAMTSGGLTNITYSRASFSNSFGSIEPSYTGNTTTARASNYYYLNNSSQEYYSQLDGYETEDIIQGLYYLQTPVLLKYRLMNGKTGITVSGGPGINLLIGNRVILRQEGSNLNIGHTRNINRVSVSGIVAVGIERRLFNNIRLLIEPRFSHFISPVNSTGGLLSLPYSFSVFGGLSYGF
ncbi:MAG: hypothetical protein ACFCUM_06900 [Bacteroidales bacterium]